MTNSEALVTIGLPVFNGEEYIANTLDSLLAQQFIHTTVFISDNASTDGTADIVASYARRDPRIISHRMADNVGAIRNFQFVFQQTRSRYFMWSGHDDIWPVDFLPKAVECLEHNKEVVLANTPRA